MFQDSSDFLYFVNIIILLFGAILSLVVQEYGAACFAFSGMTGWATALMHKNLN